MKSIVLVMEGHRYHISKTMAKRVARDSKYMGKHAIAACITPRPTRKQIGRIVEFAEKA